MNESIKSNADFWLMNKVLSITDLEIDTKAKRKKNPEIDPSIHVNVKLNKIGISN